MDQRVEELKKIGCAVEDGLERCVEDEDFYLECISMVLNDEGYLLLYQYLKNKQIPEAFGVAHMLKGIIGNVALTPMYATICGIVEPLRAGGMDGVGKLYVKLMEQREQIQGIVSGN